MGKIRTLSPGKTRGILIRYARKNLPSGGLYFDIPLAICSLKVTLCYLKPIRAMGFGKGLDLFLLKIFV